MSTRPVFLLVSTLFTLASQAAGPYFPSASVWYQSVAGASPHPDSDAIIQALKNAGGWGAGNEFRIDFSIEVLEADADTPLRVFIPTNDFFEGECDDDPVPLPTGGALEGEEGYECTSDGDCHLIIANRDTQLLYEMWRANIVGESFFGGCMAVWVMSHVYGPDGRGEQCTSADAAGYPIAPLLFTADEVAAGAVEHAIRFILPNSRIRPGEYVHPATHTTGAASGDPQFGVPYGARLRLRPDFNLQSLPNEGARTVARALQTYGMFLADGGQIALTAQSDRFTTNQWAGLLGPDDLIQLQVEDFQVMAADPPISYTGNCVLNPRPTPVVEVHNDGFEVSTP